MALGGRCSWLGLAAVVVAVAGCGAGAQVGADGTGGGPGGQDIPRAPDGGADELPGDLFGPREVVAEEQMGELGREWNPEGDRFGRPCSGNEECDSGLCLEISTGMVCTDWCIDDCPSGWSCVGSTMYGPDLVFLCVPRHWKICLDCNVDADCGSASGICRDFGADGRHCVVSCQTGADCPSGFACSPDGPGSSCLPLSGSCVCNEKTADQVRPCDNANEHGTCTGEQSCLGATGWSECDAPVPAAETCDGQDNDCDGTLDEGLPDLDGDKLPDCLDEDDDGDGIPDATDSCPLLANPDDFDTDGDGLGNLCDGDDDNDLVPDGGDNCPLHPNPGQEDHDGDDAGDECDQDDDGDGVPDTVDNCVLSANPVQEDNDKDGLGDPCDVDDDNDSFLDGADNCPIVANGDQADCDGDKLGDACDLDDDDDGVVDALDCAPCDPSAFPGAPELCNGKDDDCNGAVDENGAVLCHPYQCTGVGGCALSCTDGLPCAAGLFCDLLDHDGDGNKSECLPKLAAGMKCGGSAECSDNWCGNGYCCPVPGELCCAIDADCGALDTAAVCDAAATCTGHRLAGYCNEAHVCKGKQISDAGGCNGTKCSAGKYCIGNKVHENHYCNLAGSCIDGPQVQDCKGSNPCCAYGCLNGACSAQFNGDLVCVAACLMEPALCFCW